LSIEVEPGRTKERLRAGAGRFPGLISDRYRNNKVNNVSRLAKCIVDRAPGGGQGKGMQGTQTTFNWDRNALIDKAWWGGYGDHETPDGRIQRLARLARRGDEHI
jgi:hypothetical protein